MSAVEIVFSIDSEILERVDALAKELGLTRNRVLVQAAEELVRRQESRRLLARLDDVYEEAPWVEDEEVRERRRAQHRRIVKDGSVGQALGPEVVEECDLEGLPSKGGRERRTTALHRLFELFEDQDPEEEIRRLKAEDIGS